MAGVSWEAHPDVMFILKKGPIHSVLEYGCMVASALSGFDSSSIFFTDGLKGEGVVVLVYTVV
jgi:hypothetical protein